MLPIKSNCFFKPLHVALCNWSPQFNASSKCWFQKPMLELTTSLFWRGGKPVLFMASDVNIYLIQHCNWAQTVKFCSDTTFLNCLTHANSLTEAQLVQETTCSKVVEVTSLVSERSCGAVWVQVILFHQLKWQGVEDICSTDAMLLRSPGHFCTPGGGPVTPLFSWAPGDSGCYPFSKCSPSDFFPSVSFPSGWAVEWEIVLSFLSSWCSKIPSFTVSFLFRQCSLSHCFTVGLLLSLPSSEMSWFLFQYEGFFF